MNIEQIRRLKSTPIMLALMAGLLIIMGATFASASSSPDLSLCVSKTTGALRYATLCKTTENRKTFNVVGPQGAQGETGASGVEQVDIRTISYIHEADNPGYYSSLVQDSCLDGLPKTFLDAYSNVGDRYFLYCTLDIPQNKTAFVLNVTDNFSTSSGYGVPYYPVIIPKPCSSIKFNSAQQTTQAEQDEFNKQVAGKPPFGYRTFVRPNFSYANERTVGLPLFPNSGERCLILDTARSYQNSSFGLGRATWSIALVDR